MRNLILIILLMVFGCNSNPIKNSQSTSKLRHDDARLLSSHVTSLASDGCRDIILKSEIWANEFEHGVRKYRKSSLWSEYDYNTIDEANPIPDTIFIQSHIGDRGLIYTDPNKAIDKTYYISIAIQLKYSASDDCLNPLNPKYSSEEYILTNKVITRKELKDNIERTKTGMLLIPAIPFNLRKSMKRSKISRAGDDTPDPLYLNDIVVKTYIGNEPNSRRCFFEYLHPICCSLPEKVIFGE